MKKSITQSLTVLFSLVFSLGVAAQGPGKQHKELECLIGNWKATGTIVEGKNTMKVSGTWECKSISAGFGVGCTLALKGPDGLEMIEHDMFSYDTGDGLFHWFAVTNMGEVHDHKGTLNADGTAYFQYAGPNGGQMMNEGITFDMRSPNKMRIVGKTLVAGQQVVVIDVTGTK